MKLVDWYFIFRKWTCIYLFLFIFLGVAGFVLNEKKELLVIRERFSVIQSKPWKLPGGLADKGKSSPGYVTLPGQLVNRGKSSPWYVTLPG